MFLCFALKLADISCNLGNKIPLEVVNLDSHQTLNEVYHSCHDFR